MRPSGKSFVASGHELVSSTVLSILEEGGNAYDAAVAAGFTSALAEPALTSLGGGGFLLARTCAGEHKLFDFFPDNPGKGLPATDLEPHFFPVTVNFSGSLQDFNIGLGSVAVPGNLKGFLHIHKELGILSLSDVLQPAIELAKRGIRINGQQAYFLELLKPIMTMTSYGRTLFEPDGRFLSEGDYFYNPDYAAFLKKLPERRGNDFYCGNLARRIEKDMRDGQGMLTAQDLNEYEVIEREPLQYSYRGRRILTNPPPSFGGSLIEKTMRLLDMLPVGDLQWGDTNHVGILAGVFLEIEKYRDSFAREDIRFSNDWYAGTVDKIRKFSRGTTHLSIIDRHGNVASMTTSNGEGSGYFAPGTGIMLNNMMGEDDLHPGGFHCSPPGLRVSSMMSPTIVVGDKGVEMVLGSGGSKRIRTAIIQVIVNRIDFGMDIRRAVEAPRIHWDGEMLQMEPGYPRETVETLQNKMPVNIWQQENVYFGGVHAIADRGAGDPRRNGNARSA